MLLLVCSCCSSYHCACYRYPKHCPLIRVSRTRGYYRRGIYRTTTDLDVLGRRWVPGATLEDLATLTGARWGSVDQEWPTYYQELE